MNEIVSKAIANYQNAELAYTKFTTPNNVGATGSHESGWLISKTAWALFFDKPGVKGEQVDRFIEIKWQDDFVTQSRFVYYGRKTRNEYRLTRFGRGFPFLQEENIGDYILILRMSRDEYKAYVFQTDNDIEDFTSAVGVSVTETNTLIQPHKPQPEKPSVISLINAAAAETKGIMPPGSWIAAKAFEINMSTEMIQTNTAISSPDFFLISLIKTEYELFQAIERLKFEPTIQAGFTSVDAFISVAHSILNSRKSRAGHSLENHLATIFDANTLQYEQQVITEGNKTADFIFPDGVSYHNPSFLIENLFFMAAKTTCKDRWRQILNEADRLDTTYLMTLQQGISKNQCKEMQDEGVILVVPYEYKSSFPKEYRDEILSLHQFIKTVQVTQN
jgi:type II restriction enzyme